MKHESVRMDIEPYLDLEILEDTVQLTCPVCKATRLEREMDIEFFPSLTYCTGVESEIVGQIELDADTAF